MRGSTERKLEKKMCRIHYRDYLDFDIIPMIWIQVSLRWWIRFQVSWVCNWKYGVFTGRVSINWCLLIQKQDRLKKIDRHLVQIIRVDPYHCTCGLHVLNPHLKLGAHKSFLSWCHRVNRTDGDPDTWVPRQTCQLKTYELKHTSSWDNQHFKLNDPHQTIKLEQSKNTKE